MKTSSDWNGDAKNPRQQDSKTKDVFTTSKSSG